MGRKAEIQCQREVRAMKYLFDKAKSAVQVNGGTKEWFIITLGVIPIFLFYLPLRQFSQKNISDGPEERNRKISRGPSTINILKE